MSGPRTRAGTRALLTGGVVAGPLFIAAFTADGATRVGYSATRHPVSSLVLGPGGWKQTANILTAGALYLGAAIGLHRTTTPLAARSTPVLLGAAAVGLIGSGSFVTDPVSGYPPGTPAAADGYTTPGALHDAFAVPTFLGIPIAAFGTGVSAWRAGQRRWALTSMTAAGFMLWTFGLASAAFGQQPRLVAYGGFFQRLSVLAGFGWITALMAQARRATIP
jgi:Protein of unknown function (DUF998)